MEKPRSGGAFYLERPRHRAFTNSGDARSGGGASCGENPNAGGAIPSAGGDANPNDADPSGDGDPSALLRASADRLPRLW